MGSLAYGKMPGGAIGSAIGDIVAGTKTPVETLTMLAGVPGMNIMQRSLRTEEGQEFLTGLRSDVGWPQPTKRAKPLTWSEVLLGKEPELKPKKQWNVDKFLGR